MRKGKDISIELLRCIAIGFVILIHVVSYPLKVWTGGAGLKFMIYQLCFTLGSCGVPLFLMISGALLLRPEKELTVRKIYCRMIPRAGIPLIVWGTLFSCMELYYQSRELRLSILMEAVKNTFLGRSWDHLWYLYMLIGLYLFLPLFYSLTRHCSQELMIYFTGMLLLTGCILPMLSSLCKMQLPFHIPSPLCYIACLWLGYVLTQIKGNRKFCKYVKLFGMVSLTLLLGTVAILCKVNTQMIEVFVQYHNVFIISVAGWLFLAVSTIETGKIKGGEVPGKVILSLGSCSFGIYLLHPVIINVFYKVLHVYPDDLPVFAAIPVFFLCFLLPSWLGVIILKRIPVISGLVS